MSTTPSRRERISDLGRMTLRDLAYAFVTHHGIRTYAFLAAAAVVVCMTTAEGPMRPLAAAAAAALLYPLVEYTLHRFVLHARWMYKSRWTAALWKRIHFDHHQDPQRLDVLFGALSTTLPTVLVVAGPVGFLIGGVAGAAAAVATGLVALCIYEFCHCVQHLNWRPRNRHLRRIKRRHLAHHFHSERGNFGITSSFLDRLLGTLYDDAGERAPSATTFDLGYDAEAARAYPWVASLSASPPRSRPARGRGGAA